MVKCLALSPHRKKVAGEITGLGLRSFKYRRLHPQESPQRVEGCGTCMGSGAFWGVEWRVEEMQDNLIFCVTVGNPWCM